MSIVKPKVKIKPKHTKGKYKGKDKIDHKNPDVTDIVLMLKRRRDQVEDHRKMLEYKKREKELERDRNRRKGVNTERQKWLERADFDKSVDQGTKSYIDELARQNKKYDVPPKVDKILKKKKK